MTDNPIITQFNCLYMYAASMPSIAIFIYYFKINNSKFVVSLGTLYLSVHASDHFGMYICAHVVMCLLVLGSRLTLVVTTEGS